MIDWFQSPPGQYVLQWEQEQLDSVVADLFGFHALQLGLPELDALRANRMPFVVYAGDHTIDRSADWLPADHVTLQTALVSSYEELPFASQSIDLIVMPHVLEFSVDPHQVLREVERVLLPEGYVVITGFNPFSLWGLRQFGLRGILPPILPQAQQFIALPRIKDWLKLLSFEVQRGRFGCYRLPCRQAKWMGRATWLEPAGDRWWPVCGAVYLLTAVKRQRGMRMIGPAWKDKASKAQALAPALRTPQGQ
ncbi:class I SAM-dependent methyltransferase [Parvibium lacunae]|uniref:SAM-dependent methyltransferase n=1 Tax=Parvibium lacunae TaxID=1888893 RepID=A0A368L6B9_9BURK|nr:class I SAM-dependent methyltransferase [Parvibium lacunae]RCS59203.1 SAM-dependent methyltransferase [Parvibium lacunae]